MAFYQNHVLCLPFSSNHRWQGPSVRFLAYKAGDFGKRTKLFEILELYNYKLQILEHNGDGGFRYRTNLITIELKKKNKSSLFENNRSLKSL